MLGKTSWRCERGTVKSRAKDGCDAEKVLKRFARREATSTSRGTLPVEGAQSSCNLGLNAAAHFRERRCAGDIVRFG